MTKRKIRTLDELPLFATDHEIAEAVVGPERAKQYLLSIKLLEKLPGFPPHDPAHGGRYVPAVKAFYDVRSGLSPATLTRPAGQENPAGWNAPRAPRSKMRPA